jgi:glycosyltransferase involved in cell wall biosynthesis
VATIRAELERGIVLAGQAPAGYDRLSSDGLAGPRWDCQELAAALNASLDAIAPRQARVAQWLARVERQTRLEIAQALRAVRHGRQASFLLSTSERVGLPVAFMSRAVRHQIPHVLIAHKISSGRKVALVRHLQLAKTVHAFVCLCSPQADYLTGTLGVPRPRVHVVRDKVDDRFFDPGPEVDDGYVLAVGQERRDYETLCEAVRDRPDRPVTIVASSPWSTSGSQRFKPPSHVRVTAHISSVELRHLYHRARLVVVPLLPADYAAGVNGLLEGMATSNPVICSISPGLTEYFRDGETAVGVRAGDVRALRHAIDDLWDDEARRRQIGRNARASIERENAMDVYVRRVAEICRSVAGTSEAEQGLDR